MLDIGSKIECMEKDVINGKMEENMTDNIIWIKNKVLELIIGQMEENIKVCGRTVNSMERENII